MGNQVLLLVFTRMRKLKCQRLNLDKSLLILCFALSLLVNVSLSSASDSSSSETSSSSPSVAFVTPSSIESATTTTTEQIDRVFGDREQPSNEDTGPGFKDNVGEQTGQNDQIAVQFQVPTALPLSQASAEEAVAAVEALEEETGIKGDSNEEDKKGGRNGRRLHGFNGPHPHTRQRNQIPNHHRFQLPPPPASHVHNQEHINYGRNRNVRPQRESMRGPHGHGHGPSGNPDLQPAAQTLYDLRGDIRGFHQALGQQLQQQNQHQPQFQLPQHPHPQQLRQSPQQITNNFVLQHGPNRLNPFQLQPQPQTQQLVQEQPPAHDLRNVNPNSPLIFPSFFQPQTNHHHNHQSNLNHQPVLQDIQPLRPIPNPNQNQIQSQSHVTINHNNNIFGHNQHHQPIFELTSPQISSFEREREREKERDREPSEFRPSQIDPSLTKLSLSGQGQATAAATPTATTEDPNAFSFTPVHQPFQLAHQSQRQQELNNQNQNNNVVGKKPEQFIYVYEDVDYDPEEEKRNNNHQSNKITEAKVVSLPISGSSNINSNNGPTPIRTNQPTAILIDTSTVPPSSGLLQDSIENIRYEPTRQNLKQNQIEQDLTSPGLIFEENDAEEIPLEFNQQRNNPSPQSHASFTTGPNVEINPSSERKPPVDQSNAVQPALAQRPPQAGRFNLERERERERERENERERERERDDLRQIRPRPVINPSPFENFAHHERDPFGQQPPPNRPPLAFHDENTNNQFRRPPPPPNHHNQRPPPPPAPPRQQQPHQLLRRPPPPPHFHHSQLLPSGPAENSNEDDYFNNDPLLNQKLRPFLSNQGRQPFNPNQIQNNFNPPPNQLYEPHQFFQQDAQREQEEIRENDKNADNLQFQSQRFPEEGGHDEDENDRPSRPLPTPSPTKRPTVRIERPTTERSVFRSTTPTTTTTSTSESSTTARDNDAPKSRFPPFRGTTSATTTAPSFSSESTTSAFFDSQSTTANRKRPSISRPTRPSRPSRLNNNINKPSIAIASTTPFPEVSQGIDYDYELTSVVKSSPAPRIRGRPISIRVTTAPPPAPSPSPSGSSRFVFEKPTARGPPPSRYEIDNGGRNNNNNNQEEEREPARPVRTRGRNSNPTGSPQREHHGGKTSGKPLYNSGKMLEKEGGLYAGLGHIAHNHVYGSPIPLIPINSVFDRMPDIYNGQVVVSPQPAQPVRHSNLAVLPPFPPPLPNGVLGPPTHFLRQNVGPSPASFNNFQEEEDEYIPAPVSKPKKASRIKTTIIQEAPEPVKTTQEPFRQNVAVEDKFVRRPIQTLQTTKIRDRDQEDIIQSTGSSPTGTGNTRHRLGGRRKRPIATTTTTERPVITTTTEQVIVTVSEEVSHHTLAPFSHSVTSRPSSVVVQEETPPKKETGAGKFNRRIRPRPTFKKPKPTSPTANSETDVAVAPANPQHPRKLRPRPTTGPSSGSGAGNIRAGRPHKNKNKNSPILLSSPQIDHDDNEQTPEEAKEVHERRELFHPSTTTAEPSTLTTDNNSRQQSTSSNQGPRFTQSSVRIFKKPTEAPGRFSSRFSEDNPPFPVTKSPIQLTTKTRPSFKPAKTTKSSRSSTTTTASPSSHVHKPNHHKRKPLNLVPPAEDNIPDSIKLKPQDVINRRKPARRIPPGSVSLRLQEKRKRLQGARRKVTSTELESDGDFDSSESRSDATVSNNNNNKREVPHQVVESPHNQLLDDDRELIEDSGGIFNNSTEVDSEETAAVLGIPKPTNGTNLQSSVTGSEDSTTESDSDNKDKAKASPSLPLTIEGEDDDDNSGAASVVVVPIQNNSDKKNKDKNNSEEEDSDVEFISLSSTPSTTTTTTSTSTTVSPSVSTTTSPTLSTKSKIQFALQRKRNRGSTASPTISTTTGRPTPSSRAVVTSSSLHRTTSFIRDREATRRLLSSQRSTTAIPATAKDRHHHSNKHVKDESHEASGSESIFTSATIKGLAVSPFSKVNTNSNFNPLSSTVSPFSVFTLDTQDPSLPLEAFFPIVSQSSSSASPASPSTSSSTSSSSSSSVSSASSEA